MKKEKLLFILGLFVAILSFLGFPRTVKSILFVLTGLGIIYLAYIFYKKEKGESAVDSNHMHTFIDNVPPVNNAEE